MKPNTVDRWRRLVQILSVFALNPFFFRYMGVCIPVMNCWSCPAAAFACPVGVVGNFLALGIIPLAVIGITVFSAMVAGRILCGWVCPFGFLQDLLYMIPGRKISIPRKLRPFLFILPVIFLAVTVVAVPILIGVDSDLFFCRICPAATLEGALPLHFLNSQAAFGEAVMQAAVSWRVWILLGFLVLFIFMKRPFCRLMCPIGIALGVFNRYSLFQINLEEVQSCPECNMCVNQCPTGLNAFYEVNKKDCIHCYVCTKSCAPRTVKKRKRLKAEQAVAAAPPREDR